MFLKLTIWSGAGIWKPKKRLSKSGMEERGSLVYKLEDASLRAKHGAKNKENFCKDMLTK